MPRSLPTLAVLVVTALVAVSACSGDDADTADSTTTAAVSEDEPTGSPSDDGQPSPDEACEPAAGVAPGTELVEVTSGGVARRVQRTVPAAIGDGDRIPLLIDLHGFSSSIEQQALFSGMPDLAAARGFIVLTPQGVTVSVPIAGAVLDAAYWNITGDEGPDGAVDDVAFLAELIEAAVDDLCVDPDRVHLSGNSMGAAMATTMACARPDLVASIAPVSGVNLADRCDDPAAVPVVAFHGDADPIVPFEGGATARQENDTPSVPDRMIELADAAGCEPGSETRQIDADVQHTVWSDCAAGVSVELYRVLGGGHTWPGMLAYVDLEALAAIGEGQALVDAAGLDLAEVAGNMTTTISASELALDFFEDHPHPRSG